MPYRVGTVIGLIVLLLGLGSWGFPADLPAALQVKTYQGLPYISGGVGEEELELLRTLGRDYNLKLIFAAKEGNYVSEVSITIANGRGQKVLEAVSEGPWFYTKLPSGTYSVMAQVEGRTQQQVVQVNQRKQAQLQFYW